MAGPHLASREICKRETTEPRSRTHHPSGDGPVADRQAGRLCGAGCISKAIQAETGQVSVHTGRPPRRRQQHERATRGSPCAPAAPPSLLSQQHPPRLSPLHFEGFLASHLWVHHPAVSASLPPPRPFFHFHLSFLSPFFFFLTLLCPFIQYLMVSFPPISFISAREDVCTLRQCT